MWIDCQGRRLKLANTRIGDLKVCLKDAVRNELLMSRSRLVFLSIGFFGLLFLGAGLANQIGRALPMDFFCFDYSKPSAAFSTPSHVGKVIWSADMETGDLSQWSVPDVPCGPTMAGVST